MVQAIRGERLSVYGDGSQTRSLCYVDDLCAGLKALLWSESSGPINLGNPFEMSVLAIAKLVLALTGSSSTILYAPLPADDPVRRRPDITLARQELGWHPAVDVRDGLGATIDWFRSLPEETLQARPHNQEAPSGNLSPPRSERLAASTSSTRDSSSLAR